MRLLVTGSPGQWRDTNGTWRANPAQVRAHVEPLASAAGVTTIHLVVDAPTPPIANVTCVIPPRLLTRVVGRALSKALTCGVLAIRYRPDWIVSFGLVPHGVTAVGVASLTGARSMVHLISGSIEWRGGGYEVRNRFRQRPKGPQPRLERALLAVLRRASAIVVMGSGAADELRAVGLPPGRLHVVPASVDAHELAPSNQRDTAYDVVAVSRLVPHKRLDMLVRAVARLRSTFPGIRVAVAGDGPEREALETLARSLDVAESISFLGFVDAVAPLHRGASVFVLVSEWEGLSLAASEAMAAGLPAIVTPVGDMGDIVIDGTTGFVVPVGDEAALARRIADVLGDPALRGRLGAAARTHVVARTDRAVARRAYEHMLDGRVSSGTVGAGAVADA
jgi:glycosyltransferase involved in cell wall biosynthesis